MAIPEPWGLQVGTKNTDNRFVNFSVYWKHQADNGLGTVLT